MEIQEKPQVKKLKSLDDLEVGGRIVIKADKCPFSDEEVVVLRTKKKLQFIDSYNLSGDLSGDLHFINSCKGLEDLEGKENVQVYIYSPHGRLRIDKEGRLVVDLFGVHQISNERHNLNELTTEMKDILLKTGYNVPEGVN